MNHELKTLYDTDEKIKELINMSRRLEGLPRHTSMHAAGVVISQKEVDEYVPLSRAADGTIVTQFTMTTLEELGLLKMDFLGLRTLTVIDNAVRLVAKDTGRQLDMLTNRLQRQGGARLDRHRKDGGCVPARKWRDEELYEGAEAAEPGGYHRRYFSVPSGSDGLYSAVYPRKK